jgi:hypothetical protein
MSAWLSGCKRAASTGGPGRRAGRSMATSPGGEKETTDPYGCRFLLSARVPRTPESGKKFFPGTRSSAVLPPLSQVEPTSPGIERRGYWSAQKRRPRILWVRSLVVDVAAARKEGGFQPRATLLKAKSPGRSQGPNTGLFMASTGHALHVTPVCMHSIVRGALIELNGDGTGPLG